MTCQSRRSFLKLTGMAAGTILIQPSLGWGRVADRDFRFVIVSDTHLGIRKGSLTGEKAWTQAVTEISQTDADFAIHLGDLVDTGAKNEKLYPVFVDISKGLKQKLYAIPGNHDPVDLFQKYVDKQTDTSFDHKGVRFILFEDARTDSHDGFITEPQLKWLDEQMQGAQSKGLRIILCMHVAAHDNKHPDVGWYVKPESGQGEFYKLTQKYRDSVLAIFNGHFHCGLRGWNDHSGIDEIVFPSALWNTDRQLEKNGAPGYALDTLHPGYAMISMRGESMMLEYKPFGEASSASKTYDLKRPSPSVTGQG